MKLWKRPNSACVNYYYLHLTDWKVWIEDFVNIGHLCENHKYYRSWNVCEKKNKPEGKPHKKQIDRAGIITKLCTFVIYDWGTLYNRI